MSFNNNRFKRNFQILPFNMTQKGFSLLETIVYLGILGIIISSVVYFFTAAAHSSAKIKSQREVFNNLQAAMDRLAYEIKGAKGVYLPTSILNIHPGQLSLETEKQPPTGETASYLDFYICQNRLCLKRESQNPVFLTSEKTEIANLIFELIATASAVPSIQVNLKIDHKNPSGRKEFTASASTTMAVSLRAY